MDIIIQLLGTCAKSVGLAEAVDIFFGAVDFAGFRDIDKGIDVHFGVNAQILQIGFGDE